MKNVKNNNGDLKKKERDCAGSREEMETEFS